MPDTAVRTGGAVSPSGTVESSTNLAVAKRLDSILGLYGANVIMLREKDVSLHDPGSETLRQKKVSDLHNRVKIIEETPNATLISIHQNTYSGSSKYHGAQVFMQAKRRACPFAKFAQETLRVVLILKTGGKLLKIPDTVYLMNHITCRAILVECGFLSNPDEDVLLQTSGYQTKIATALAGAYLGYSETNLRNHSKMRAKTIFYCTECGNETPKWVGKVPACGSWNTMVEQPQEAKRKGVLWLRGYLSEGVLSVVLNLLQRSETTDELRFPTGLSELDRVLGGGAVQGSLVLVGGAPGIGKSTLMLQICDIFAAFPKCSMYPAKSLNGRSSCGPSG